MKDIALKDVALAICSVVLAVSYVMCWLRIKELKNINENIRKVNENLLKPVPDIKSFVNMLEKKDSAKPAEPAGIQLFVATRAKGAPDIMLGEISKVYIAAFNRKKAMELLRKIKSIRDDDWWILDIAKQEKVVDVKYLGGVESQ